ncbi:MAG: DotI/IcmL/TraM family protein [Alphaproteobacteria bacterium]
MAGPEPQQPLTYAEAPPPPEDIDAYKEGFKYLLWFVKLESLSMLGICAFVLYMFMSYQPQDSYFAIGVQGNQEQLVGLTEPNMNKAALLAWISAAATQVTTFGFTDYAEKFAQAQKNFSPDGWKSYQDALIASGLLKNVNLYQQIITSIPINTPIIQAEGILEGQYRWIVSVTLVQTIRAGNKKVTRYLPVTMILIKMPTAQNPMGVGINTWVEVS